MLEALEGKVVFVTGSARRVGRTIALGFAANTSSGRYSIGKLAARSAFRMFASVSSPCVNNVRHQCSPCPSIPTPLEDTPVPQVRGATVGASDVEQQVPH